MRYLVVEASNSACRYEPQLHRFYRRLKARRRIPIARIAVASQTYSDDGSTVYLGLIAPVGGDPGLVCLDKGRFLIQSGFWIVRRPQRRDFPVEGFFSDP